MVTDNHYRWDFIGLSTDEKPTPATSKKVTDGSTFYCSDNSKLYVWYKDQWYEKEATGGGGTSYTAGDGIDITNDTISVDTSVVQEKLTAGTGITISEDNEISAEGGSVNVVQTTGGSTTDVMSQKATTDMVMSGTSVGILADDRSGAYAVAIGKNSVAYQGGTIAIGGGGSTLSSARTSAINAIAIGSNSNATAQNSISLGEGAKATRKGELNISTEGGTATDGFNNTKYRVIGGVHDGQDAHDAVTVEQVNSVIDAINTALSTNIPHIGA